MFTLRAIESLLDEDDITLEDFVDTIVNKVVTTIASKSEGLSPELIKIRLLSDLEGQAGEEGRCPQCLSKDLDVKTHTVREEIWGAMQSWEEAVGYKCNQCDYESE